MPLGHFFSSTNSCGRGTQCYFQHVRLGSQEQLDLTMQPPNLMPTYRTTNSSPAGPAITLTSAFPHPLIKVICRYFKIGGCKSGDKCRSWHDAIGEEEKGLDYTPRRARQDHSNPMSSRNCQDIPKTEISKTTESNTRDLGGALVRFGSGRNFISIEPAFIKL